MNNNNDDQDYKLIKNFANEILRKLCTPWFTSIDNLNLENIKDVLISVFKSYEDSSIDHLTFVNIGEALNEYIVREFGKHYSDTSCAELEEYNFSSSGIYEVTFYPEFDNSDPRSIGIVAMSYMNPSSKNFDLFPKDVSHFLEFLNTPAGQEEEAHKKLKQYVSQFDFNERLKEANERSLKESQRNGG